MSKSRPEDAIHRAVWDSLRKRGAPGAFCFHVPNQGKRSFKGARLLQSLGMVAGVPDIICIHEGRCYALELKAEGRHATAKQLEAKAALETAGAFTCVAEGLERAIAVLEQWGLLKGRAQ